MNELPTIPCVIITAIKDGEQTSPAEIIYVAIDNEDAWDNARKLADELLTNVTQGHDDGVGFFAGESKTEIERLLPSKEIIFKTNYIMVGALQLHEVMNYILQLNKTISSGLKPKIIRRARTML